MRSYRRLVQRDPDTYLPFLAATLNNLALAEESQGRIEDASAHYKEALNVYQKLFDGDPRKYAGDVGRVTGSLRRLEEKTQPSRTTK